MQMLLLEGDDMNQKTGICILLCLVLLLVFGIWYQKRGVENQKIPKNNMHPKQAHRFDRNSLQRNGKCLYIRTQDSRLVVFLPDGKTVYRKPGFEVRI